MTEAENNLPLDLQHPGGFVEDAMGWINETAVCPQPIFALASALCLAGTLYGRHVKDESGQRTNLYLMGVGFTSCGKDHALKAVSRALDACEATDLRLGQVTSDSAVEYALRRNPHFAMLIDEAGHFFASVTDAKASGSPLHALKPALLELWSCAGGRWKGKQRVPKGDKEAEPAVIDNPHVCLFGMTQPQIFFDGVASIRNYVKGAFDGLAGPWVKGRNYLSVQAVEMDPFKTLLGAILPVNNTEGAKPTINTVLDETTLVYDVITGTDVFSIAGSDLAPDTTKDDEYVALVDAHGVETKAEIDFSDLQNVKAHLSAALLAGEYTLKVYTRSGLGDEFGVRTATRRVSVG